MAAADVNIQEQLIRAIFNNRIDDVRAAIEAGANVNGTDFGAGASWEKPLLWAAMCGMEEIAILLIEQGSAVNVSLGDGQTPLHHAARGQKNELIKALISKGAYINAQDSTDSTPLHLAAEKEGPAMATLIERGARQDLLNSDNKTATELNAERIQRASVQGAGHGGAPFAGFWERLTANTGPLTPDEEALAQNRNRQHQSRMGG